MAQPCSELATHAWLKDTSALGELIDFDFEAMDLNRLYRASDALYKHREALQEHLFGQARSMFDLGQTITLYDLTNTYFEGVAAGSIRTTPSCGAPTSCSPRWSRCSGP